MHLVLLVLLEPLGLVEHRETLGLLELRALKEIQVSPVRQVRLVALG